MIAAREPRAARRRVRSLDDRLDAAVVGIALGTLDARALAVAPDGRIVGGARVALPPAADGFAAGRHEQDPDAWWRTASACLVRMMHSLASPSRLAGVAVTSTSGTVLAVDDRGRATGPALLYDDARGAVLLPEVRAAARELEEKLGHRIDASFGLPKLLWMARQAGAAASRSRFVHAADFLSGRLTGDFSVTDWTNALKSGFDVEARGWPSFLAERLGLAAERLPRVVAPGTAIGRVCATAAAETGLPAGLPVFAGATDGVAALLASGATRLGDWSSSLGETLVIKGITRRRLGDAERGVYSHLHPDGRWLPGGAANVGAAWIGLEHHGAFRSILDAAAALRLPTPIVRYPLLRTGERFPFAAATARGFCSPAAVDEEQAYAAGLEGVALVERLAYRVLDSLGARVGDHVHVTGSGARSPTWLRIRASMLGRELRCPPVGETAFGAAILAASSLWFGGLGEATRAMVRGHRSIEPDRALVPAYDQKFGAFVEELRRRGWLTSEDHVLRSSA